MKNKLNNDELEQTKSADSTKDRDVHYHYNALDSLYEEMMDELRDLKPPSIREKEDFEALFKRAYVSPDFNTGTSPVILQIKGESGYCDAFSLGNISTILGKAKSRKTMLTALLISSIIEQNNDNSIFKVNKLEKNRVLVFDTEQSKDQIKKTYDRVKKITQKNNTPNLNVFSLRSFKTNERLDVIKKFIRHYKDTLVVVIDGIRDLLYDINNITESTELVSGLLQIAEEYNIHIVNVIHQNKSDNNARGHLGSEIFFKSEVGLMVSLKNNSISIVSPKFSRHEPFDPFSFGVDETGTPYLMVFVTKEAPVKKIVSFDPVKHSTEFQQNFLNEMFNEGFINGYEILKGKIKNVLVNNGFEVSDTSVVKLISNYLKTGIIKKLDNTRPSKYCL